jgi:hypothetical protein
MAANIVAPCECPMAGWCERHKVAKGKTWHGLCRTSESYRKAWDEGRGPGQTPMVEDREERRERIKLRIAKDARLRGWVSFFRVDGERGIGDTAWRLRRATKSRVVKDELRQLMRVCACKDDQAIKNLNEMYPY